MTQPTYTEHHPRWLRQRISTYWWLGKWPYTKFILRELSSLSVAWFVGYLLVMVRRIGESEASYRAFLERATHPVLLTLDVIAFLFIVFHALTWFAVAPQAIVAHVGKKRVAPAVIAVSHYAAWIVVSALVAWLLLRR